MLELSVDTHGQSPWHFVTQALLDALRAITHSPTGKARGTLPFGFIGGVIARPRGLWLWLIIVGVFYCLSFVLAMLMNYGETGDFTPGIIMVIEGIVLKRKRAKPLPAVSENIPFTSIQRQEKSQN